MAARPTRTGVTDPTPPTDPAMRAAADSEPAEAGPGPRSRRTLLAGLVGGVGALVVSALDRVPGVRAAAGDPLLIGQHNNAGTSQTILNTSGLGASFTLRSTNGASGATGIFGWASHTGSNATRGVYGRVDSSAGDGVQGVQSGAAGSGAAVRATGNANHGLVASANGGFASRAVLAEQGSTADGAIAIEGVVTSTSSSSDGSVGVRGRSMTTGITSIGVWGSSVSNSGIGVRGTATSGSGVTGEASSTSGTSYGVRGSVASPDGIAGRFANSGAGVAVWAQGSGSARTKAALQAHNTGGLTSGGMAAYLTNGSSFATAHFRNTHDGEVLYLHNGGTDAAGANGGDFIKCVNAAESDAQFRVLSSGEARSDVGFNTPAADFAEMLEAVPGVEPGDVLVIGADGKLTRSDRPHQENVAGVHSTRPGFVGGKPIDGDLPGTIPLAVVGIVPVKASAENGSIAPGDLLTTSSTPGHAMRANGEARVGCVIGKALRPLSVGTGAIEMLVVLQ